MYEFSSYKECPSGTTGIGKPWRWDTYKFNPKGDPYSPIKTIRIDEESCTGRKDFHPGIVNFSPLLIRIRYLDNLGHFSSRELTVHRDTITGTDGELCEYIEEPIIKN
jgi:hypothetical protein